MAANNDKAVEISSKEFEETIHNGKKPVTIIDFYAEWCLDPRTKLIFNPCVRNIEKVKEGSKVLSFDKNFKESFAKVKSTHKILSDKKVEILTERGRKISCTPEHLILTNRGFSKAGDLSEGDFVSTYLFSNHPEIKNDKRYFLKEEDIVKAAKGLGLDKKRYLGELKEKGLLEIRYNEENAILLASLMGLLLSDGSLSSTKNSERLTEFFVTEKDKEEVIKDLGLLGFKAGVRKQKAKGEIGGRKFNQEITRIRVCKTSLFILLKALGAVEGRKFINGLRVPDWIIKAPSGIQRAFLQGFLGGDGPKVEIRTIERGQGFYNKPLINPLELHFYDKAGSSPEKFAEQVSCLMDNFGVKIKKIEIKKEEKYARKDGKASILLKIHFKTDFESAYAYSSIGFKYAQHKNLSASLAKEYLRERLERIKGREKKREEALKLKDKLSISAIAKKLNLSYTVINNWLNGKKAFPPKDAIRYSEWLKRNISKNKIAYDRIKEISKHDGGNYSFISMSLNNNTKMFVANDIIHHNCMPCLMLAPVFEELASKIKEAKFARVNVDENRELSSKFNVTSIPCLIIFKEGKEVERITGALPEEILEERIKKHI